MPGLGAGTSTSTPARRRRPLAREGRPDGLPRRAAAADRLAGLRVDLHLGRRRLAGRPCRAAAHRYCHVDLRAAPGLVAQAPRRQLLHLGAARRRAGALRHRAGLHPRRDDAGDAAPLRRVVGLPRDLLLRRGLPLRRARRLQAARRPAAPGRHRGHPRLGARSLRHRRVGPGPLRRHRSLRAPGPAPGLARRVGLPHLRLRAPRGPQLPLRQRSLLARGVPRRRPACRRRRLDALPRLRP